MDKDKVKLVSQPKDQVRTLMLMGGEYRKLCAVLDIDPVHPNGEVASWVEVIDAAKAKGEAIALLDVAAVLGDVARALKNRKGT